MTDVRINTVPLGGTVLSRRLQQTIGSSPWLAPLPQSIEAWSSRLRQRAGAAPDWNARLQALRPALQLSGVAAERFDRVQREGGLVVTTGQQPGLFGGSIYTWSKAMSAIALAEALERETGIPTMPVYWAATDDADFAEASVTHVARPGGVDTLRSTNAPPPGTPMSAAMLGDLNAELARLRSLSGSAADARPLDAVSSAYADPSRSVGDAFILLLRELLAPLGMPVLDASHPAVHAASGEVLDLARQRSALVEAALSTREGALRAAGFEPQVEGVPGLSLVFQRDGALKRRLTIEEAVHARGGIFTPNVLLRPIVEQAILPTVAYVAGPGELAYFAQCSAAVEALGLPAPLAVPRWSCELIEPQVQTLLNAMGVTPSDLSEPHVLEQRVARGALAPSTTAALEATRTAIRALPGQLAGETDPIGLGAAVIGAMQSLEHRVDRLERRVLAGIKRRETDALRDVATLRGALYPNGVRQERLLNLIPMLARNGLELLPEMCAAARDHANAIVTGSVAARA